MNFGTAVSTCLQKYADFSGRAARPEFWWFFVFNVLVSFVATTLDQLLGLMWVGNVGPIDVLAGLALLVPNLAVGARRLHDAGNSGWLQLLFLIPCVGLIILIVMFCRPGQPEPNQYGVPQAA